MADNDSHYEYTEERVIGSKRILMLRTDLWHFKQDRTFADWANALHVKGHRILLVTSGLNQDHCHADLLNFPIIHVGSWIPLAIRGYFKHFFYLARTIYCALFIVIKKWPNPPDLIINGTNPISIPILKYLGKYQTVHLMNFSEILMLNPKQELRLTKPWYYQKSLQMASEVFVESKAAREIYENSFKISQVPKVLNPCVDVGDFLDVECCSLKEIVPDAPEGGGLFVCIGPMRPSTNFELAMESFELAMAALPWEIRKTCHLVIAGHVNDGLQENVEYYDRLRKCVMEMKYSGFVSIIKRLPLQHRKTLIKKCLAVVVPNLINPTNCRPILEAMFLGKAVLATNIGVHKEIVNHRITGFLLEPKAKKFAHHMFNFVKNKMMGMNLGALAYLDYTKKYGFKNFSQVVDEYVHQILGKKSDVEEIYVRMKSDLTTATTHDMNTDLDGDSLMEVPDVLPIESFNKNKISG